MLSIYYSSYAFWMRDAFEHRRWPPLGSDDLDSWGIEALQEFCKPLWDFVACRASTCKRHYTSSTLG